MNILYLSGKTNLISNIAYFAPHDFQSMKMTTVYANQQRVNKLASESQLAIAGSTLKFCFRSVRRDDKLVVEEMRANLRKGQMIIDTIKSNNREETESKIDEITQLYINQSKQMLKIQNQKIERIKTLVEIKRKEEKIESIIAPMIMTAECNEYASTKLMKNVPLRMFKDFIKENPCIINMLPIQLNDYYNLEIKQQIDILQNLKQRIHNTLIQDQLLFMNLKEEETKSDQERKRINRFVADIVHYIVYGGLDLTPNIEGMKEISIPRKYIRC